MTKVLLDCDTGIDDALALVYLALRHLAGEIELVGVTTTAGNTTAAQAAINTKYVLGLCGVTDVPVAAGSPQPLEVDLVTTPETHGDFGLGYLTPPNVVVETNWQRLWRLPHDHLIITGPATNAAQCDSAATKTVMGGAYLYRGNTTPMAEWNSWVDPHGAAEFFACNKATVCSLEVTEQFTIDPEKLEVIAGTLHPLPIADQLGEMLRFYFEFHQAQGEGYLAQIHDLLTCMIALDAIEYEGVDVTVDVEKREGLTRGTTIADFRNHWGRPHNAHLVQKVDIAAAHAEFLRVCALR